MLWAWFTKQPDDKKWKSMVCNNFDYTDKWIINWRNFSRGVKKAVVIPIFKKGDATNLNNYRPISLLPVMSKLFEKVLNKQITQVLDINGYIDDDQYGFRMQHSTEDAIVKFVDTIEKGLGENKHVVSISVDVSKAFDSCNHNIILAKMEQTGLNEQGIVSQEQSANGTGQWH